MGLRGVGRGLNFGQALVKVGNDPVKTQDFLLRKYGRKSPMSKREPFLWSQRENWRGGKALSRRPQVTPALQDCALVKGCHTGDCHRARHPDSRITPSGAMLRWSRAKR